MDKLIDLFWFLLDLLGMLFVVGFFVFGSIFVIMCVIWVIDRMGRWFNL